MDLKEAGIDEGISEVIVTTKSASGKLNAAPIGIITTTSEDKDKDKNNHFVKLYEGSKTLSNLMETNKLMANVTDDAVLFVKAAFDNLNETYFSFFSGLPALTEANSWIIFQSVLAEECSEFYLFQLTPIAVKINRKEVKAINRGLNAVIEATILATRYDVVIEDEREKEELKKLMVHYAGIVKKCGGRREKEAMGILDENFLLLDE